MSNPKRYRRVSIGEYWFLRITASVALFVIGAYLLLHGI
jgi:hypothetical protein